jgi:hypothetical protein
MTHVRNCDQCGAMFAPRREHARFCSARCRVTWNRDQARPQAAEATALDWSITAMGDATGRLLRVRAAGQPHALAAVSEAVWWVTIVDSTLLRYHARAYDNVLAEQSPAQRRLIEGTLAGLRFVRNQMGLHLDPADFIRPAAVRAAGDDDRGPAWTWASLPEPPVRSLPPSGQAWERTRYRAYQARLAGQPVQETFGRAAQFLTRTAARADLRQEHSAPPHADSTASSRAGRPGRVDGGSPAGRARGRTTRRAAPERSASP